MDVSAACSGFVYGYATAQAYITSGHGPARPGHRGRAAHPVPRLHRPEHLHPVRRRSRGGRPVRVRRARRRSRHRADDRAPGRLHDLAARRVARRARRRPRRSPAASTTSGWKVARRTASRRGPWPRTALAAIEQAGLKPADIDLFIPHQANVRIIEAVAKGLDLPMDRMFVNVDRYGNTSAASVPIALAEAVEQRPDQGRRPDRDRRLRRRLHLGRSRDRVDRRPGPGRRWARRSAPTGVTSGRPSTGTRSIRSRTPWPRSWPGPARCRSTRTSYRASPTTRRSTRR